MRTKNRQDNRPLIFLAVLMSHAVVVFWLVRSARQAVSPPGRAEEPLVLMLLHELTQAPDRASDGAVPASKARAVRRKPAAENPLAPDTAAIPPEAPTPPSIDWQHEAELAAQNGAAAAETEKNYRDLSALSLAQLSWSRQNHMVRAPPGIQWSHPRLEFMPNGLPVFWINDHCVLVTVMVFCSIGHIEPNGGLFKHMRDPHDP